MALISPGAERTVRATVVMELLIKYCGNYL